MNTNTENLKAASLYWKNEVDCATHPIAYVVASPAGLRVIADNTSVMIAGACAPYKFFSRTAAKVAASNMADQPLGFADEGSLEVMTYERFCEIQHARFEVALHTVRVADAMAYQNTVAA